MQKPTGDLEKEFNRGKVFFTDDNTLDKIEGELYNVIVDIGLTGSTLTAIPDFGVTVLNGRGLAVHISDWELIDGKEQRLSFRASIRIPEQLKGMLLEDKGAMSFLDLCFFAGNEAVPEAYQPQVFTEPREGYEFKDLGWTMPSRFVDALIDALGRVSDSMLAGAIQEAIIYGPFITRKQ